MTRTMNPGGSEEDQRAAMTDLEVQLALGGVVDDNEVFESMATVYGAEAAERYLGGLGNRVWTSEE
jgi:hypothetical protein